MLERRDAIAGIAAFAFFAMVIERALNAFVLQQNEATATLLANPVWFVIYGAFAAGICEETGRFIVVQDGRIGGGGVIMAGQNEVALERLVRGTWVIVKQGERWLVAAYHNSPLN